LAALQLMVTGVMLVPASGLLAQRADDALLGLINSDGSAHLFFAWDRSEWSVWPDGTPGAPLILVDSLGRTATGRLGDSLHGIPWIFGIHGGDGILPTDRGGWGWVGYFTSPDVEHAPFLRAESPLSVERWRVPLSSAVPTPDENKSDRMDIRVWTAETAAQSFTYFAVDRHADCHRFTGWIPSGSSDPVIATSGSHDCEGKGEVARRPLGLIVHGGQPVLAVAVYGIDGYGMELWELLDGELRLQGAAWGM
jgi:hypothetical protein